MDVIFGEVERDRPQRGCAAAIRNRIREHLAVIVLSIIYAAALVYLKSHGSTYVTSDRSQSIGEDGFIGRSGRTLRNKPLCTFRSHWQRSRCTNTAAVIGRLRCRI